MPHARSGAPDGAIRLFQSTSLSSQAPDTGSPGHHRPRRGLPRPHCTKRHARIVNHARAKIRGWNPGTLPGTTIAPAPVLAAYCGSAPGWSHISPVVVQQSDSFLTRATPAVVSSLFRDSARPVRLELPHARYARSAWVEELLGTRAVYDQPYTALHYSCDMADAPIPGADAMLRLFLERYAASLVSQLPGARTWSERTRNCCSKSSQNTASRHARSLANSR